MHALIVVSHPDRGSLTHAVATQVVEGLIGSGGGHTVEIADLAAEGFDPRFTSADIAVHLRTAAPSADVLSEQARLDRADALVLVYPVFWWSMPALLKGWIDRVFSNGWAYDEEVGGKTVRMLERLRVHLVAIGGADMRTYARHGYFGAMKTQIDHGIFGYCGARVVTSELLVSSDSRFPVSHLERARDIGRALFTDDTSREAA
ncbi:NAD(P)H-dependent oxidoreductase [Cystobacter ferrugineus]|uniref:NAD(P)H dehydrogenase n=1 Tax=Cystobacter ferrugineus TaxID=83449 RepID=A0A1L9BKH5_9BACT|nr:NAD(P)H-dependent oxidoreductase [Cystobacter ferrugineus]OJH42696.1 NAD(P)H dehydrogenase [Cystobacter ferrugineus]